MNKNRQQLWCMQLPFKCKRLLSTEERDRIRRELRRKQSILHRNQTGAMLAAFVCIITVVGFILWNRKNPDGLLMMTLVSFAIVVVPIAVSGMMLEIFASPRRWTRFLCIPILIGSLGVFCEFDPGIHNLIIGFCVSSVLLGGIVLFVVHCQYRKKWGPVLPRIAADLERGEVSVFKENVENERQIAIVEVLPTSGLFLSIDETLPRSWTWQQPRYFSEHYKGIEAPWYGLKSLKIGDVKFNTHQRHLSAFEVKECKAIFRHHLRALPSLALGGGILSVLVVNFASGRLGFGYNLPLPVYGLLLVAIFVLAAAVIAGVYYRYYRKLNKDIQEKVVLVCRPVESKMPVFEILPFSQFLWSIDGTPVGIRYTDLSSSRP